jgi:hypothetical protein
MCKLAVLICILTFFSNALAIGPINNVIVYYEEGRFCGWPANNGTWSWGNEILVGFTLGYYNENPERHSIDREKPRESVMARSVDGGETWKLEKPEAFKDESSPQPKACPGNINFTHPDFAFRFRGNRFWVSYDRGRSWSEPYQLSDLGQIGVMPRTDYIVYDKDRCQFFLTATKRNGREGRPFMAETRDGGRSIGFFAWMAPEPEGYSIMPSTVRLSQSRLVSAIRRYDREPVAGGWIDIYHSADQGLNWEHLSKVADTGAHGGNPPSMIQLKDGRLAITYGYRSVPYSIRAKMSSDEGATWGPEIMLRDDARSWDLGYTRTVQRPDGKLVTVYYYSTEEHREMHIAGTIWE